MERFRKERARSLLGAGMLGPGADQAFASLTAPQIRRRVWVAHLVHQSKHSVQQHVGRPLGRAILRRWMHEKRDSSYIESLGLPRHIIDEVLGEDALTLHVDPRKLIRIAVHAPRQLEKRPSSMAFIWEGSWDERREDLRAGTRYRLIAELDEKRDNLEQTERYKRLMAYVEQGKPWASHQLGVVLDSHEKIIAYLRVYLDFLDDMALNGFDSERGKDPLGVAITRDGTILKVNRGLHRLAMAQRLGLPSVPVRVCHVHRLWWNKVVEGTTGMAAFERLQHALQYCAPEQRPGPQDSARSDPLPENFWPAPRIQPTAD